MWSSLFVIFIFGAVCSYETKSDVTTREPLKVYWNIPTGKKCNTFKNLYEKYGIIQNSNDTFSGDQITILYDPGSFPALLENSTTGQYVLRNGGVPQEGNWDLHELEFRRVIDESIPNPLYNGIGIIDFESWRPVFRQNFGRLSPYKDYSYKVVRRQHPLWPSVWVESEAKKQFEASARLFMASTLALAKQLRPNAQWGYYGFPYCFNMQNEPLIARCSDRVHEENDRINWMWEGSTALFPSVYSSKYLTSYELSQLVKYRVKEAARVRNNKAPILPYFWFRYRDGEFMKEVDLITFLKTIYNSPANGFIIWGSFKDVNTPEKCANLHEYLEKVMGPAIAKYAKVSTQYDEMDSSHEIDQFLPDERWGTEKTVEVETTITPEPDSSTSKPKYETKEIDENEMANKPKLLKVYWNVPSEKKCKNFDKNLHERFGIIQNTDDKFQGDKITIFYKTGSIPANVSGVLRNGGLPQNGSWDEHETEFKRILDEEMPNHNFDGIGILDFEEWRPIFRQHWGKIQSVKDHSYYLERLRHPTWNNTKEIEKEAEKNFELSARLFMEWTLVMAKVLRPKAQWGYYQFPLCFNLDCSEEVQKENDRLHWLWKTSTILAPSVYISVYLTSDELRQMVESRVKEAARVRKNGTPILPYFKYRYREDKAGYLKEEDLYAFLDTIYNSPADGFVIWDAWKDINSQEKCNTVYKYLNETLGPAIAKYTKLNETIARIKSFKNDQNKTLTIKDDLLVNTNGSNSNEDVYLVDDSTPSIIAESSMVVFEETTTLNDSTYLGTNSETTTINSTAVSDVYTTIPDKNSTFELNINPRVTVENLNYTNSKVDPPSANAIHVNRSNEYDVGFDNFTSNNDENNEIELIHK